MTEKKHKVYLHGKLGRTYTKKPFTIYGTSVRDIVKGLCANLGEGFKNTIRTGQWHITIGKRQTQKDVPSQYDSFIGEEFIELPIAEEEVHIYPVVQGAGAVGRIILGVVLIIIGIVITVVLGITTGIGGAIGVGLIGAGIGMVIGGIVQALTKPPKIGQYQNAEKADQRPSFIFNGVINTTEQGGPVPLVYGRHLTGSTVISAGITVEQL